MSARSVTAIGSLAGLQDGMNQEQGRYFHRPIAPDWLMLRFALLVSSNLQPQVAFRRRGKASESVHFSAWTHIYSQDEKGLLSPLSLPPKGVALWSQDGARLLLYQNLALAPLLRYRW